MTSLMPYPAVSISYASNLYSFTFCFTDKKRKVRRIISDDDDDDDEFVVQANDTDEEYDITELGKSPRVDTKDRTD